MAKFKLHNGKEVDIPDEYLPDFEEMGKGYMRWEDYTRKRQAEAQQLQQAQAQLQQYQEAAQQAQAWQQWWENGGKSMYERFSQQQALENDLDEDYRSYFDTQWGQRYQAAQQEIANYVQQAIAPALQEIQRTQGWARHLDHMNRLAHAHYSGPLKGEAFRYDDLQKLAYERGRSDLKHEDWQGYYNELYRDPLLALEVKRKTEEEKAAQAEKDKAATVSGKTGSTSVSHLFQMPEGAPSSWEAAGEGALSILKEERAKRGE